MQNIVPHLEERFQIAAMADLHDEVHVAVCLESPLKSNRAGTTVQRTQCVDLPPQPLQQLLPADPVAACGRGRQVQQLSQGMHLDKDGCVRSTSINVYEPSNACFQRKGGFADLPVPRVRCRPRGRSLRSFLTATSRPLVRQVARCTVPKLPTPSSAPSANRSSKLVGSPSSVPCADAAADAYGGRRDADGADGVLHAGCSCCAMTVGPACMHASLGPRQGLDNI
jgi:hypothetical protein